MIEMLIVIVLIGLLVALVGPVAGKLIRRSEDMAALSSARQVLAVARLEAVRRSANVVVEISLSLDNRIRLRTFQDRANDKTDDGKSFTSPLPGSTTVPPTDEALAAGNCIQDPTGTFAKAFNADGTSTDELTLGDVSLSPRIHFWKQGGTKDDVADAVRFDTYLDTSESGNISCGTSTDRIIFLANGGISTPQDSGSGPNPNSTIDQRGIYFADWQGKNYFRVTVESDLSGKARVDKYIDGSGYYPPSPARRWGWL